jgi:CheY-like chemotaxis protein
MPDKFGFTTTLLIDDSEIDVLINRRLMELTFFSSNIVSVRSAEEGLSFLHRECKRAEEAPDWIFLDMYLPMMNGYDFIDAFKNLPSYITEKSKIVVLSVIQRQDHLLKIFENKFVFGQLEKPLTQEALKNLVNGRKESIIAFS